jgi:thiosulfate dehydrogenase [quinone] large subunit
MALKVIRSGMEIQDPPLARFLFGSVQMAWLWLLLRLYLGYQWLEAGWHKVTDPRWMETGEALKGFWERAVAIPAPPARPPIAVDWYRSFLEYLLSIQAYTWFAKLVTLGELAVGIALILGLFTGIAAFTGGFMNWNFMMAGTASTNPLLFAIATWLVLAWKVAGYYGLDRWVLPALGTPWQRGALFGGPERQRTGLVARGPQAPVARAT